MSGPVHPVPLELGIDARSVRLLARAWRERIPVACLDRRLAAEDRSRLAALCRRHVLPPGGREPGLVLFTTGTTGEPKGVLLSRRAIEEACEASAARLGWRPRDRWGLVLSPARAGGAAIVLRCLLAGRPAVPGPARGGPAALARWIAEEGITLLSLVPAQLARLFRELPGWRPPPSLRAVLLGGAAPSPALLAEAARRGVPALPTWGMTETFGQVATVPPGTPPDPALGAGPPLPGRRVRVREGRLEVSGIGLMEGYWPPGSGPDPWSPDGWLVTSDRGRLDESGRVHVLGRADDVIVTGGEKVDPAAVEAFLCRLPGVDEALVFGVPDGTWGELVAAAIVPGDTFSREEFRRALGSLSPAERPRRIALVDGLPLRGGKPDRRRASRLLAVLLEPP